MDARRFVIDRKPATPGARISGIAYVYASASRSVRELAACGALESDPATLEAFGFDRVHVAAEESPYDLAHTAAARLLDEQGTDPATIDLIVYAGTPSAMAFAAASDARAGAASLCTADRFRYPATRLQHDLGLEGAAVLALDPERSAQRAVEESALARVQAQIPRLAALVRDDATLVIPSEGPKARSRGICTFGE